MERQKTKTPLTATLLAILLPGLGYFYLGQRRRAVITGVGVLSLFMLGILFAGIRVINIPGFQDGYLEYVEVVRDEGNRARARMTATPVVSVEPARKSDERGNPLFRVVRRTPDGLQEEIVVNPPLNQRLLLTSAPGSVLFENMWFFGQIMLGPITAAASYLSILAAQSGVERSYGRIWDVGSLYTAVAGMLNLLLIVDVSNRAGKTGGKG